MNYSEMKKTIDDIIRFEIGDYYNYETWDKVVKGFIVGGVNFYRELKFHGHYGDIDRYFITITEKPSYKWSISGGEPQLSSGEHFLVFEEELFKEGPWISKIMEILREFKSEIKIASDREQLELAEEKRIVLEQAEQSRRDSIKAVENLIAAWK